MHYVHKGGEDSSLFNHRPLTLVDVLRKVCFVRIHQSYAA